MYLGVPGGTTNTIALMASNSSWWGSGWNQHQYPKGGSRSWWWGHIFGVNKLVGTGPLVFNVADNAAIETEAMRPKRCASRVKAGWRWRKCPINRMVVREKGDSLATLQIKNEHGETDVNPDDNDSGGQILFTGYRDIDSNWEIASIVGKKVSAGNANHLHDAGELRFLTRSGLNPLEQRMVITKNGRVGIGTTAPEALLHVEGSGDPITSFTGGNNGGAWMDAGSGAGSDEIDWANAADPLSDTSIYASGSIVADGTGVFVASTVNWSDERAKEVLGKTDNQVDLETLAQIEVTDYRWIDRSIDGHKPHKKAIAQQLREVFPQAVVFMEKAIPSVYQSSKELSYDRDAGRGCPLPPQPRMSSRLATSSSSSRTRVK